MIAFGLAGLRLAPAAFWTLTLPELSQLVRTAAPGGDPISRGAFAALMTRYPDKEPTIHG